MLKSLIVARRLPIHLQAIRLVAFKPIKSLQRPRTKKDRPPNLYDDIKNTLPANFVAFLNEFDNENLPDKESIEGKMGQIRPYHIRFILDKVLSKDSPRLIVTLLPHFLEHNLIDDKTIIPVVQAVAKAWIQVGSTDEIKALAEQLMRTLPAESKILVDLEILLRLCSDEWPVFDVDSDRLFMLKNDCFKALIAGALRHSDLKQLKMTLSKFPQFFIHSDPHLFKLFLSCIRPNDSGLASAYFDHLNGQMIAQEEFDHIKHVITRTKVGKINASKVIDGECAICKTPLTERLLTNAEFETMREAFSDYLKEGCEDRKLGSNAEFYALQKLVKSIKERSNYKSAVVVDALNLNQGNLSSTRDFVECIRSLKKQYDLVVLIARHRLANNEDVWNLGQEQNIRVFAVGKYSHDDLFSIYAAMNLGHETILVSNDRFVDIAGNLKIETKICELFNIWAMNQIVGYRVPLFVFEPNRYSNLLSYSPKKKAGHFMAFYEHRFARKKLFCFKL